MWLINSSIGRKVVMSVTGIALVLFLTFHASMNVVALISAKGYNMICEFLGANWYAVVATIGLAALVALHFIYAIWLTLQNRKARGNNRYAVTSKPEKVEWASQNMLVLGFIVIAGMLLHLYNFWFHMMYAELVETVAATEPGNAYVAANATNGVYWIAETFSCYCYTAIYLVWLAALWFHLTHGFWSALQTLGWNGKVWFQRWKCIGMAYTTIIILMFAVVAIAFGAGYRPCDYEQVMKAETAAELAPAHCEQAGACPMMMGGCHKMQGQPGHCKKMAGCHKAEGCQGEGHCQKGEGHCQEDGCSNEGGCQMHEGCPHGGCPQEAVEHNHRDKAVHDDCAACAPLREQGAN